jgi:hypothetical protein
MNAPKAFAASSNAPTTSGFASRFTPSSGGAKIAIYALIVAVLVTVIVLAVDYAYPFLPMNPFGSSGPSASARAGKTFWKTVAADSENMIVPAAQSPTTLPGMYSVSAQIIITDSRTPNAGKFRHILHRGSNPAGISAPSTGAGSTGQAGIQPSDIASTTDDAGYLELGLPKLMNPGVFLDKYKNDVHIFVHTKGKEGNMEVLWLESITVPDMPLNTAFTLGIICNGKQLDIYINCRLFSSTLLRGIPYMPTTDNQWFGRYGAFPFTGVIKNLELWDSALGSTDYLSVCRGASFSPSSLPSACPTAGSCSTPAGSGWGNVARPNITGS